MHMQADTSAEKVTRRRKFHFSSIAAVLVLFIIPWMLIAIPGERKNKSSGEITQFRNQIGIHAYHGWPAIHGASVKCSRQMIPVQPTTVDPIYPFLFEPANTWDVFHYREFIEDRFVGGFWTNLDRWPSRYLNSIGANSSTIFFRYKIHWPGLLVNMLFVTVVSGSLFYFFEYRIRRLGSPWRVSLFESIVSIFLFCSLLAWLTDLNRTAHRQNEELTKLRTQIPTSALSQTWVERKEIIPSFVSRLFDYTNGFYPLDPNIFRPISKLVIENPHNDLLSLDKELSSIDLPYYIHGYNGNNLAIVKPELATGILYLNPKSMDRFSTNQFVNVKELEIHSPHDLEIPDVMSTLTSFPNLESCKIRMNGVTRQPGEMKELLKSKAVNSITFIGIDAASLDVLLNEKINGKEITILYFEEEHFVVPSQEAINELTKKGIAIYPAVGPNVFAESL